MSYSKSQNKFETIYYVYFTAKFELRLLISQLFGEEWNLISFQILNAIACHLSNIITYGCHWMPAIKYQYHLLWNIQDYHTDTLQILTFREYPASKCFEENFEEQIHSCSALDSLEQLLLILKFPTAHCQAEMLFWALWRTFKMKAVHSSSTFSCINLFFTHHLGFLFESLNLFCCRIQTYFINPHCWRDFNDFFTTYIHGVNH